MDIQGILDEIGAEEWFTEGDGIDSNLIAPDRCVIEQDGQCPHGHVSPLRAAGLI